MSKKNEESSKDIETFHKRIAEMVEGLQGSVREIAANSKGVQNGEISLEDELQQPSYKLYQMIVNMVANIHNNRGFQQIADQLLQHMDMDCTELIMAMINTMMIQGFFQIIVDYDEMIKKELTPTLDGIIERLNSNTASITAHQQIIEVYKKQIGELENTIRKQQVDPS